MVTVFVSQLTDMVILKCSSLKIAIKREVFASRNRLTYKFVSITFSYVVEWRQTLY
jgi:hypothetical protein